MTVKLRSATGRALHVLGDRWTLLILRGAFVDGTTRYGGWKEALAISDAVLSDRLKALVEEGVFERRQYGVRPPRDEYVLTRQGDELWQLLAALWGWEREWLPAAEQLGPPLRHSARAGGCGAEARPQLVCGSCTRSASLYDIRTTVTASGRHWLAAPDPVRRRSTADALKLSRGALHNETMQLLGDRWSATLIALALLGNRRFADFERAVVVSPTLLSDRLRSLVALGVLTAGPAGGGSSRREYLTTPKGRAFFPPVALLLDWADRWFAVDEATVEITHVPCQGPLRPALACGTCAAVLTRAALELISREREQ